MQESTPWHPKCSCYALIVITQVPHHQHHQQQQQQQQQQKGSRTRYDTAPSPLVFPFFFFWFYNVRTSFSYSLFLSLSFRPTGETKKNHKIAWERGGKKRCTPTVTPAVPMLPTKYGDRNINPPEKKTRWKKKCFVRNKVVTEFCLVGPKLDFCIVPPPLHKKK